MLLSPAGCPLVAVFPTLLLPRHGHVPSGSGTLFRDATVSSQLSSWEGLVSSLARHAALHFCSVS